MLASFTSSPMDGPYRTPGRESVVPRIPWPSCRTLLSPLKRSAGYVALVVAGIALFNWLAPAIFETSGDLRLIPAVDWVQGGLAALVLGSLIFLGVAIARRVQPSWGGLRLWMKILYVAALVVTQSAVILAAEATIFFSRGGLKLFGPSHLASAISLDGRMAHIYSVGGLSCGYDVFVSGPLSITGRQVRHISRGTCLEPTPQVRWNADGSVDLVDAQDRPLESQPSPSFSFGGGC